MRFVFLLLLVLPGLARAQDSDNGTILTWIEESISTPDRMIRLNGVEGALSSSARIAEITIADQSGVWLQIVDAEIEWSRAALFSARLEIASLTAAEINILRRPESTTEAERALPSPEAVAFSLPELPVDIQIDRISTGAIQLSDGVIGPAARLTLEAAFRLDEAGLVASLTGRRLDGVGGDLAIDLNFRRADQHFAMDARLAEPEDGVIANLLAIDHRPALRAEIAGEGVLDDLRITLGVDVGQDRLIDGALGLQAQPLGRDISAHLHGEIAGLLPAPYRPFFNGQSALELGGLLRADGGVTLDRLHVTTAEMQIAGALETEADGFPRRANLAISLESVGGGRIVLPFGPDISVARGQLDLQFGQVADGSYALAFSAEELALPGFDIAVITGGLRGAAAGLEQPETRQLRGEISLAASGIAPASAAQAAALGDAMTISAVWDWAAGGALNLHSATAEAAGAAIEASGTFRGTDFTGEISAALADISSFSALAGRQIAGALRLELAGRVPVLGGQFDVDLRARAQDLRLDQPQIDALLAGESQLFGHIRRDETGLTLRDAGFTSPQAQLRATGMLSSADIQLDADAALTDLAVLIPALSSPAQVDLSAHGPHDALRIEADLRADNGLAAELAGIYGAALDLRATFAQLPLAASTVLRPELGLDGLASGWVQLAGTVDAPQARFALAVEGLAAAPLQEFGLGPLTVAAQGQADGAQVQLDELVLGDQAGLEVTAAGRIPLALDDLDLRANGQAPLALARPFLADAGVDLSGLARFDLALRGAPVLDNLTGRISTAGASLAMPAYRLRLANLDLEAELGAQELRIAQLRADMGSGGQIALRGRLGLDAALPVDLRAEATALTYSDGALFTTTLDAALSLQGSLLGGPLLGGEVQVQSLEIQVPSGSAAAADLPEITHINVPRPVRRTQARAGLLARQSGPPFRMALDLGIAAPARIFVRGRGLDAELGGALRLTGDISDPVATGQFDLLRGRLDLLGQRIVLTEGAAQLAGQLMPILDLRAETRADDRVITVQILGPASAPDLVLSAVPELPQDEILARLIFARGLDQLSPFQIAQLAGAVAELSGRSNGGLITRLRRAAGLDNLDIRSTETGSALTAGTYLRDNIYTEVEIGSDGNTGLSINLDIIDGLTGRAEVDSTGETGLGIFFERDY